jgi:hypothetical protein
LLLSLSRHDAKEAKWFLTDGEELVNLVAGYVDDISWIKLVFFASCMKISTALQNIDAMIMGMLIERGMTARLDCKVAHVEVG